MGFSFGNHGPLICYVFNLGAKFSIEAFGKKKKKKKKETNETILQQLRDSKFSVLALAPRYSKQMDTEHQALVTNITRYKQQKAD